MFQKIVPGSHTILLSKKINPVRIEPFGGLLSVRVAICTCG